MPELTGEQRIQIIVAWIKKGGKEYMDKESFVHAVCKAKNITYIAPPQIKKGD